MREDDSLHITVGAGDDASQDLWDDSMGDQGR